MVVAIAGPRNEGWTKAMNGFLRDASIRPVHRLLYVLVQSYTRDTWRWCTEPHRTLAADYGCTERQIERLLDALVTAGLLLARPHGHGRAKAYLPIVGLSRAEIIQAGPPPTRRRYPTLLSGNQESEPDAYPTFPPALPDENVTANPTLMPALKEDSGRPVKTGLPESGDPVSASPAPARETSPAVFSLDGPPRPAPKPQPLPAAPAPEPPPPPPPPRAKRTSTETSRPRTAPPETLEPTPALRAWALEHGFTEQSLADEIEGCLDKHRVKGWDSGSWQSSLRIWLKNEVAYAARDERQPGVHAGPAARKTPARRDGQSGDGNQSFRPGQMIGQVTGWPGAGYSDAALEAASDPGWFLKIPRDEQTDTHTDEQAQP